MPSAAPSSSDAAVIQCGRDAPETDDPASLNRSNDRHDIRGEAIRGSLRCSAPERSCFSDVSAIAQLCSMRLLGSQRGGSGAVALKYWSTLLATAGAL